MCRVQSRGLEFIVELLFQNFYLVQGISTNNFLPSEELFLVFRVW